MLSDRLAAALARRNIHYGWVVAATTFLTMLVTAGAVDPSLRHHRDRERQLALQEPRRRSAHNPRSRRLRNPGQLRRRERYRPDSWLEGVKIGRRSRVKIGRRLTFQSAWSDSRSVSDAERSSSPRRVALFTVRRRDGPRYANDFGFVGRRFHCSATHTCPRTCPPNQVSDQGWSWMLLICWVNSGRSGRI
jgi:hypothetical protein